MMGARTPAITDFGVLSGKAFGDIVKILGIHPKHERKDRFSRQIRSHFHRFEVGRHCDNIDHGMHMTQQLGSRPQVRIGKRFCLDEVWEEQDLLRGRAGDIDGVSLGIGYNKDFDNGMFLRAEGNYMEFDGTSVTSSSGSQKITLDSLDGVTGKLSLGKSF